MKNYKKIIGISILAIFVIGTSCKKDVEVVPKPNSIATTTSTPKRVYEKRWEITSSSNLRTEESTLIGINAIEFVYNSYIIFYQDNTIETNNFSEIDANNLNLKNFGKLNIVSVNENNFQFNLSITGGTVLNATAKPANVIASSSKTGLLCNTWKVISTKDSLGIDIEVDKEHTSVGLHVTFSKYGTYYVHENVFYNSWKWTDSNENSFLIGSSENNTEITVYIQNFTTKTFTLIDEKRYFNLILVENFTPLTNVVDTSKNEVLKNARFGLF